MYSLAEVRPNDDDGLIRMQYAHSLTRVDEAWLLSRGGGFAVAVLDSGVDYTHPDLKTSVENFYDFANKDSDSMDDEGHGTKVAGIIGAQGNNGIGVAGVAWDSSVWAFKVCRALPEFHCSQAAVAAGIKAAAFGGAKIINMSFGWEKEKWEIYINSKGQIGPVEKAIQYAKAKGVIIVASAGNENSATPIFPCAYPGVLCVGSTTAADIRRDTSNFGPHVRVAAPGVDLLTTVSGGGYAPVTGTSVAAPYVAGVAALVWASHPTWTAAQVEERILKTGVPLPGQQIGPRVDAFDAVFNGSFEAGEILDDWTVNPPGFANITGSLLPGIIDPFKGKKMAKVASGTEWDTTVKTVKLARTFKVLPLLGGTIKLPIQLHYSVLTAELPTTGAPDEVIIKISGPGSEIRELMHEVTTVGAFVPVGVPPDLDISCNVDPSNDVVSLLRWSAWKNINVEIPVTNQGGTFHLEVLAKDGLDAACETSAIIDNIRFK